MSPNAAERAAGAQLGQPLPRCSSVPNADRCGPEPDARLEGDRHRRVDPRELLDRDAQRGEVGAGPAVLRRERQPEQPEPPIESHGVDGERVLPVPSLRLWRDLPLREVAHDLAKCFVFLGEIEIQSRVDPLQLHIGSIVHQTATGTL